MEAATAPVGAAPGSASSDGLKRAISRNMLLLFVIGDVLGAGHLRARRRRSATGSAARSGPSFLLAIVLAFFTAVAYAELVTKYPRAAGAALYVNKAFGVPFVTFMVAFAVMCSGLGSASTLARAFGGDYLARVRRRCRRSLVALRIPHRRRADQLPRDRRVA